MKYFWTSDLHLGHYNIITYCHRPFFSLEDMNNTLIKNWNSRVKKEDTVFHVGDFCFKNSPGGKKGEGSSTTASYWEEQLNGKIIHIKGNHDRNNSTKSIITKAVIHYGGKDINLVHNPEHADFNFEINFVGHVHEKWVFYTKARYNPVIGKFDCTDCINVGIDVWNFMPVTFEEIMKRYNFWRKNEKKKNNN